MASGSYALQAAIALVAAGLNVVPWAVAAGYVLALAAINAVFYGIFHSHLNLRFAEPNLTFVQVLAPLPPGIWILTQIDLLSVRLCLTLTVVVVLLYGMLDLSMRRFLAAAMAYFLAYFGACLIIVADQPARLYAPAEWIVLFSFAVLLIQIGIIGGFISHLRQRLRSRNHQLNRAMAQISEMAIRDDLTGLFNRRRLLEALNVEIARAGRGHAGFSVCMLDIDHFKRINDGYGHMVGDRVLAEVAGTLGKAVRGIDTLGRFGGEEFFLIMPMTGRDAAWIAANRLRALVERMQFVDDAERTFRVTTSVGVAVCTQECELAPRAVTRRADRALYEAKAAGRNCVALADER